MQANDNDAAAVSSRLARLFPLIPTEDLDRLRFYTSGQLDSLWGLGERPAVLVVDMTVGFVENERASTFVPAARECAGRIARLLERTRAAGLPTFYSRGAPFRVEAEAGGWLRGRGLGITASSNSEEDRKVIDALRPGPEDVVVIKAKQSAFFGTQLNAMLNYLGVDSLIVAGVTTSGCVRATVNDAFALNYRVVIPIECVADRSQISHQVELFDMAVKYADVLELDQLIPLIAARSSTAQAAPD